MELSRRIEEASKFDGFFSQTVRLRFRCVSILSGISRSSWNSWELWESCDSHGDVGLECQPTCWNGMLEHLGVPSWTSWTWETDWARRPQNIQPPKIPQKLVALFWCEQKSGNPFHEKNNPSSQRISRLQVSDRQGQGGLRLSLEHDWGCTNRWLLKSHFFRYFEVNYVQCIMKILLFIYILRLSLI